MGTLLHGRYDGDRAVAVPLTERSNVVSRSMRWQCHIRTAVTGVPTMWVRTIVDTPHDSFCFS